MNYNIWLFAEIKKPGDEKWTSITPDDLCADTERFLPDDELTAWDVINNYDMVKYDDLSDVIKSKWGNNSDTTFRTVSLDDLRSKCCRVVNEFDTKYKFTMTALGMSVSEEDGGDVYVNANPDDGKRHSNKTISINKELLEQLHRAKVVADKARGMLGILDSIDTLAGNAWETVCHVRLILIGG